MKSYEMYHGWEPSGISMGLPMGLLIGLPMGLPMGLPCTRGKPHGKPYAKARVSSYGTYHDNPQEVTWYVRGGRHATGIGIFIRTRMKFSP